MPERNHEFPSSRLRSAAATALCLGIAILVGCDKLQIPQVGQPAAAPVVPAGGSPPTTTPASGIAAVDPPAPPATASAKDIVAAFLEKANKPGGVADQDLIAVTELTEGLDVVTELKLSGAGVTDVGVARLPKFPKLSTLDLSTTQITGPGIVVLKELPELRKLGLGHTLIDDKAMENVGELKGLQELNLSRTAVTDRGMAELGKLDDLEALDISESITITGTFFQNLKSNKKLKVLRAHHTILRGDAMKFLANCPIEELNLEATAMTDVGMLTIGKMNKLQILNLGHCNITDEGIKKMVVMKDLETVSFRNNNAVSNLLFAKLMKCKKLKYVDVTGTRINAADVAKLAKLLPECQVTN